MFLSGGRVAVGVAKMFVFCLLFLFVSGSDLIPHDRCEPINIRMCSGIPYNLTIYPNILGNVNQEQAGNDMSGYYPLISVRCSADIQLFLCVLYAPVCTMLGQAIPPCRELCISARTGCNETMATFGFSWPREFQCSNFPLSGTKGEVCVGDSSATTLTDTELNQFESSSTPHKPKTFDQLSDFKCPSQLQIDPTMGYKLTFDEYVTENCGMPCHQNVTFFDSEQISIAHGWILSWSILALLSCLFTLATFLIDRSRFGYPERPIIYITVCFGFIALMFIVGFAHDEDIVCNDRVENATANYVTERTIKQGAHQDWRCTLSAMFVYFFLIAGSLWWLILTMCWLLSAECGWGQEAIESKAHTFHSLAWSLSAVLTIFMVVLKKIEGDVLSGVCFIGLWDRASLLYFVIIPLTIFLVIGTVILIIGYFSLFQIRTRIKRDGGKVELEKLKIQIKRIGVFSMLYTIPSLVYLICLYFEYAHLPTWMQAWQEDICRSPTFKKIWQPPCRYPDGHFSDQRPLFGLYLVKYMTLMAIPIFSGSWVWCRKTFTLWSRFFSQMIGGQGNGQNV